MARTDSPLVERLGPSGLSRVLDDVLDATRLARLASACGLKYPGMRTRSQKRERLIRDLVSRSDQPTSRREIQRQLSREGRPALREWKALSGDARLARVDALNGNGKGGAFGRHLLIAALDGDGSAEVLERLKAALDEAAASPPVEAGNETIEATPEEVRRLRKKVDELQRKLERSQTQLEREREALRRRTGESNQRKGEIAETRLLVDRLRRQLKRAEEDAAVRKRDDATVPDWDGWTKTLKRVATEQKKLAHAVEKASEVSGRLESREDALSAAVDAVAELKREVAGLRRDQKKESGQQAAALEALTGEVGRLKKQVAPKPPPARRAKPTIEHPRVGVFIDVQNVYYAARRLKGKLDFGTLLEEAVRDRRLIQATAYVVESKETDQSSFISVLEQRGITVRRKSLRVRADGSTKGDWDMELALDVLDAAKRLDVVVLVSGDGDFTSLLHRVKQIGPRCEVFAFPRNTAKSLQEAADRYQPLDRRFMIYASRASGVAGAEATADRDASGSSSSGSSSGSGDGASPPSES